MRIEEEITVRGLVPREPDLLTREVLVIFTQGGAVDFFYGNCVRTEALYNTNDAVRAIAAVAMFHLVRLKKQALDGRFRLLVSD